MMRFFALLRISIRISFESRHLVVPLAFILCGMVGTNITAALVLHGRGPKAPSKGELNHQQRPKDSPANFVTTSKIEEGQAAPSQRIKERDNNTQMRGRKSSATHKESVGQGVSCIDFMVLRTGLSTRTMVLAVAFFVQVSDPR